MYKIVKSIGRIVLFLGLLGSVVMAELYTNDEIFNYKLGDKYECLNTKSYNDAIGKTKEEITKIREADLEYSSCIDPTCCCASDIRKLFKKKTKSMTHDRTNPAVDFLIEALRNQRVSSDIKIEELVHLKYANAIYSFYDKDGEKMKKKKLTMPKSDEDGCVDTITFRKLKPEDRERKGVYREGMLKDILALLYAWDKGDKMIVEKNMMKMSQ